MRRPGAARPAMRPETCLLTQREAHVAMILIARKLLPYRSQMTSRPPQNLFTRWRTSRRSMLRAAGLGSLAAGAGALGARGPRRRRRGRPALPRPRHGRGRSGRHVDLRSDPLPAIASTSRTSPPPSARASTVSRRRDDGSLLREYEIFAVDREIEIAPGLVFPAWTFNGQVPGPTLRATEGDRVKVRFTNQGTHPHTLHFHGWHPPAMDGSLPEHQVRARRRVPLRVRRRAVRPPPLPLPRHPAEAAHPQGSLRRLPGRPQDRPVRPPTRW